MGNLDHTNPAYYENQPQYMRTPPAQSAQSVSTWQNVHGVRPDWSQSLTTFHDGRISRQFVLHFNINDFAIDLSERDTRNRYEYVRKGRISGNIDQLQTMREYLHGFLFEDIECQSIYTYSLAGGLIADDMQSQGTPLDQEMRGPSMQRLYDAWKVVRATQPSQARSSRSGGQPTEGQEVDLPNDLSATFKLLGHMLRQKHPVDPNAPLDQGGQEAPIAVILDYAEKLIPFHLGEGQGDREQLQALEVIQRWAIDSKIRKTSNIIILLTTNIGLIPTSVYSEGSGCRAIRVPLPTEQEREAFIRFKLERAQMRDENNPFVRLDSQDFGSAIEQQAHSLARSTQGMRLVDIDNMSRRIIVEASSRDEEPCMKKDDVQRTKSEVIQSQSAELLEIVPPVRGFKEIGGLQGLKDYLSLRTQLMFRGEHSPLVPSGLLLAGPPGTGKTIIAEALAMESGFNLVKMRGIRDKWVGSSERNLDLVINLLKDLYPVVVFVDEIDQAWGRRDTGQSGDSGVSARMFGRILEEMSNPSNRGHILWVAATNRADIIDDALLRRFDRVIPLLTPDVDESCRIFATMLNTIIKQSGDTIQVVYGGDLEQLNQEDVEKFRQVAEQTVKFGLTGAGIEIVVRRAIEMAYEEQMASAGPGQPATVIPQIQSKHLMAAVEDFKPNHNRASYDYQSLLAIRACNFHSVIPRLPNRDPFSGIQLPDGKIDLEKLDAAIRKYEHPW